MTKLTWKEFKEFAEERGVADNDILLKVDVNASNFTLNHSEELTVIITDEDDHRIVSIG